MHCDLVTWGYEYKLISTMAASCCLCLSVSPTSPKSIHTLSHLDETWCQGRGVFFNSVVAVSFCSVESGGMAPRGENAYQLSVCVPECVAMGEWVGHAAGVCDRHTCMSEGVHLGAAGCRGWRVIAEWQAVFLTRWHHKYIFIRHVCVIPVKGNARCYKVWGLTCKYRTADPMTS